jgi:hypothetical protein
MSYVKIGFDRTAAGAVVSNVYIRPMMVSLYEQWYRFVPDVFFCIVLGMHFMGTWPKMKKNYAVMRNEGKKQYDKAVEVGASTNSFSKLNREIMFLVGRMTLSVITYAGGIGILALFAAIASKTRDLNAVVSTIPAPPAVSIEVDTVEENAALLKARSEFKQLWGVCMDECQNLMTWYSYSDIAIFVYGFNIFLVYFASFDGQPRLMILVDVLVSACFTVVHFFILFLIAFISFAVGAHLLFGDSVGLFSSVSESMGTCFRILAGELDFLEIYHVSATLAVLWFWMFSIVMFILLINFVLSIVVFAFMEHGAGSGHSISLFRQVYSYLREHLLSGYHGTSRLDGEALVDLRAQLVTFSTPKAKEDEEWAKNEDNLRKTKALKKVVTNTLVGVTTYQKSLLENFGDWKAELNTAGAASQKFLVERCKLTKEQAAALIKETEEYEEGKHDRETEMYNTIIQRVNLGCKFLIEGLTARTDEFFSSMEEMVQLTEELCAEVAEQGDTLKNNFANMPGKMDELQNLYNDHEEALAASEKEKKKEEESPKSKRAARRLERAATRKSVSSEINDSGDASGDSP